MAKRQASAGSKARSAALEPDDPALRIPHMGWNTLDLRRPHPVLTDIPTGPKGLHAYFVHSYAFQAGRPQAPSSPARIMAAPFAA